MDEQGFHDHPTSYHPSRGIGNYFSWNVVPRAHVNGTGHVGGDQLRRPVRVHLAEMEMDHER